MAGFLYFIPRTDGRQTLENADLEAAGLGYATTAAGVDCQFLPAGRFAPAPDLAGVLVSPQAPGAPPPRLEPDKQLWRKGPKGRYWVGMAADARPAPADLQRSRVYDGNGVKLLDGHEWIVPRALAVVPGRDMTLPRMLGLADDGETPIYTVHPRFADLCDRTLRWWLDFTGETEKSGGKPMTNGELIALAIDSLAVNYRVGKVEVLGLLQLWSEDEYGLVARALIDADALMEYAEKKRRAGHESATSSGGPGGSTGTSPATPTSPG